MNWQITVLEIAKNKFYESKKQAIGCVRNIVMCTLISGLWVSGILRFNLEKLDDRGLFNGVATHRME